MEIQIRYGTGCWTTFNTVTDGLPFVRSRLERLLEYHKRDKVMVDICNSALITIGAEPIEVKPLEIKALKGVEDL